MPIFEIEKDGQIFELDAPDMRAAAQAMQMYSQRQAPAEEEASVGGFLGNAASDAGEIVSGLAHAVMHPIDTASAIAQDPAMLAQPYIDQISDPAGYAYEKPVSSLLNVSGAAGLARGALVKGGMAARSAAAVKAGKAAGKISRATDPFLAAAKAAGGVYRGGKTAVLGLAGQTSATGKGPARAFEAGAEGAYQGAKAFLDRKMGKATTADPNSKDALLSAGMRDSLPADEATNRVNAGVTEVFNDAQTKIDAMYAPLKADRTPMFSFDQALPNIIDKARKEAYHSGGVPWSATTDRVFKRFESAIKEWVSPPPGILAVPRGQLGTTLAKDAGVSDKMIRDFGGDPATTTAGDFYRTWIDQRRSFEGMDGLKQSLSKIYDGYVAQKGAPDRRAGKMMANVVDDIQKIIEAETAPRHGTAYMDGQKLWSDRMKLIKNFRETFGYKTDTVTRRLTAINRDGVFTNFGNRLKELREMQKLAPSMKNIEFLGAGQSMNTWAPRNLLQGTVSVLGVGYLSNPLYGVLTIASHMPRAVGEAARGLGRIEGWVLKPAVAVAEAINRVAGVKAGSVARAGAQVGAQAGKAANEIEETRSRFKEALLEHAKKSGVNIHPSVIARAADRLLSDDPDEFMRALKTVSGHERLMKLITSLGGGTKGER